MRTPSKGMIRRKTPLKRAYKPRREKKRKNTRKGALPSISKLIKACDKEFSIKVRNIGKLGEMNSCFTCGAGFNIKRLQCGHYLSRYYKAARWDFDNARPQCMMCNMRKRGDSVRFRQNLIEEIGEARVLAVEGLRNATNRLTREFLENKLKELQA